MLRTHREFPLLRLALLGFDAADAARMQLVGRRCGVEWMEAPLAEADALLVNGERMLMLGDDTVVVDIEGARPVRLDLPTLRRPVAVSPPALTRPSQTIPFDCGAADSIQALLSLFERRLREEALQFCVASCVAERQPDLSAHAYHLCEGDKLVALVSRRTGIGVLRGVAPETVYRATWIRRPLFADEMPARLASRPLPEVLWRFGRRSLRNLLPPRLQRARLAWRKPPDIAPHLLDDVDLAVIRSLAREPATVQQVARATGLPPELARRSIACLHLVGCVDAARAQGALFGFTWRRAEATEVVLDASAFPLTAQLFGPAAAPGRLGATW
jgi:hypothetical protein